MSENHCRSHFWPFQINTKLHFYFFLQNGRRRSFRMSEIQFLIAFLAISDRYATLNFFEIFDKMAAVGHFGCPKFTLDRISGHFRSILNFIFV